MFPTPKQKNDSYRHYKRYSKLDGKPLDHSSVLMLIGVIGFSCILLLYCMDGMNYINKHMNVKPHTSFSPVKNHHHLNDDDLSYFIKTSGCKMPRIPLYDDQIHKYMEEPHETNCQPPPPITKSDPQYLWIEMFELDLQKYYNVLSVKDFVCYVWPFERIDDFNVKYQNQKLVLEYGQKIKVHHEFVQVNCVSGNVTNFHQPEFHFFMQPKEIPKNNPKDNGHKFNVAIIGVSSVSRLNLRRQMPRTFGALKYEMGAFEMNGYSSLTDDVLSNLMPVIWNKFEENNYRTGFFDDSQTNQFQNGKGFMKSPIHYNTRPIFHEMQNTIGHSLRSNQFLCLGRYHPSDYVFDYTYKFMTAMRNQSSFSFSWTSTMTDHNFTSPQNIDNELSEHLIRLQNDGLLENTILFVMSDRGLRVGPYRTTNYGSIEEHQPFLFIRIPKLFQQLFPDAITNLKLNRKRLCTFSDVYETLTDLIDPLSYLLIANRMTSTFNGIQRDISLFLPIPENRTCSKAGITSNMCTCGKREYISVMDKRVLDATDFMVSHINLILLKYIKCKQLSLHAIKTAYNLYSTGVSYNESNNPDVMIQFETIPGFGKFEGTVQFSESNGMKLIGNIQRISSHGVSCIKDNVAKAYCHCNK